MNKLLLLFVILAACSKNSSSANVQSLSLAESIPEGYVQTSSALPVLTITTKNAVAVTSKDDYLNGHLSLDPKGMVSGLALEADLKIKGHGNSTWSMPKKPYKIKFTDKQSVLGMPADKEWILLANYSDKSLIRNPVAFELSRRIGMIYTPRARDVEVVLNGTSQGTYTLAEEVKIAPDRVNITETDNTATSGDALTGGYMVEQDNKGEDDSPRFNLTSGDSFIIKDPDPVSTQQTAYISNYFQQAYTALYAANFADPDVGYAKYIDVDSFIGYYLVNEIYRNVDAAGTSSVKFYKDINGKLKMGPVWDFDIGAGNVNYSSCDQPVGWHLRANSVWFKRLFQDPAFEAKVKAKWKLVNAASLLTYIDYQANLVSVSQTRNFVTWPILNTYVWPNAVVPGSYQGEVDYFKTWLSQRLTWMDTQLGQ